MTKPHEETWTTGDGALSGALYAGETWIGSFTDPKRARLAVQAPRMAQALAALLQHSGHVDDCPGRLGIGSPCYTRCASARSVLEAAGVIP